MTDIDYEVAHGIAQIELAKAKAKVERLMADNEVLRRRAMDADEDIDLRAEIERLRIENDNLKRNLWTARNEIRALNGLPLEDTEDND